MPNYDFLWNPTSRDLEFQSDGELAFVETQSQLSTQCGTILLLGRCFNVLQPSAGIGYSSQILGNNEAQAGFQLNRWNSQVAADNGQSNWRRIAPPPNIQFDFESTVSYRSPTS